MNKVFKWMKKEGAEVVVNLSAKNIPNDMKAGVFCYACELVFADGFADADEQKNFDIVKTELNIGDDLAYKVAEVVTIKNKL